MTEVKKKGISIREAANKYSLCHSTISRNMKKDKPYQERSYGRPTALTAGEEKRLVDGLLLAAEWGMPFDRTEVRTVVKRFLDKQGRKETRFKDNLPGIDWCISFLNRHKEPKTRCCENIKRSRAAVSKEQIGNYFDNLEVTLKDVSPDAIINYDETNLTDDPGRSQVIVRRGAKHAERIMDSTKTSTSAMFAGTASGKVLPPFVVYKSKFIYDTWTEYGPGGTVYDCSNSGWFDNYLFEQWFFKIALKHFKDVDSKVGETVPKLLIGDNLASHLSISVIEACRDHNIRFVFLPPNSTHICQPLDVAYFRPLKIKWKEVLAEYKTKHKGTVPKFVFPGLLKKALDRMDKASDNLRAGFRASGIYPLNRFQVLKKLPSTESEAGKNADESWSAAFVDVLKEARFGNESVTQKRKKRIQVEPGQTVKVEDIPSSTNKQSSNEDKRPSTGNASKEDPLLIPKKENEHPRAGNKRKKAGNGKSNKDRVKTDNAAGNKKLVTAAPKRPTKKPRI
ncbi:jerky protein homolog-like [Aedes aegypti]|uniref:Uncharacterized protein n=1 Tax=Aedes aegypti TaxID=7159 RepID=A0A6I8U4C6_AEDAE|nr:jerky protein homolog-like [Aedes aegypti]